MTNYDTSYASTLPALNLLSEDSPVAEDPAILPWLGAYGGAVLGTSPR